MLPLNLTLLLAILVVAVILWRSKENFMETSYYYEAAPGARGARMICMPESAGSASLGIAVGKAAGDAAAQVAKRACGNMFDVATVDSIVQETKLMATSAAEDATLAVVPTVPIASLALLVGIDRFMSECRAITNLIGNGVATVAISRWEGEVTPETLRKNLEPPGDATVSAP